MRDGQGESARCSVRVGERCSSPFCVISRIPPHVRACVCFPLRGPIASLLRRPFSCGLSHFPLRSFPSVPVDGVYMCSCCCVGARLISLRVSFDPSLCFSCSSIFVYCLRWMPSSLFSPFLCDLPFTVPFPAPALRVICAADAPSMPPLRIRLPE
uniref:Uncharacterized protein n=1 Tax=Leishmania guyanensis TaxID=5670 RepID=A0A1E1IWU8_LEIGU|nr:Hypothetical protein BN36_2332910 [Leishmania guyanensis]